ncbi:hypothetical protein ANH9776_06720 [Aggregatibacter actinomycetemcomitans serotype e str. ANH9776]|nr:hypothetical protein SA3096_01305 [Aggregatibacter actinomycetemcomitans serotype e str. SA3096]KYK94686.1 hypothetical protein ANH9776_06720 [Aggregatibacter actinomycetemcomitans serotype e str. ANH9776]
MGLFKPSHFVAFIYWSHSAPKGLGFINLARLVLGDNKWLNFVDVLSIFSPACGRETATKCVQHLEAERGEAMLISPLPPKILRIFSTLSRKQARGRLFTAYYFLWCNKLL